MYFLSPLLLLWWPSLVSAYAPLGSKPVERCEIHSYECPSHYICVTYDKDNYGTCTCDRFYGFYGPTCEKLSVASYLLIVLCILNFLLMSRIMSLNLEFAYKLHRTGSLEQNALCRCLFFNVLSIIPTMGLAIGFFVDVTSIDKQMVFHEFVRSANYACILYTFILSTMSISLAWIETVEKTRRRGANTHRKYKSILYGISLFSLVVCVISFRFSFTDILGVFAGLLVTFSYTQAKHMVTEALSVMEENGDIVIYEGASDVLNTIKQTSKKMMIYSLLVSGAFLVVAFTITLSRPRYKQQDQLPRYLQGQIAFFLALVAFYQINLTCLEYLKSAAKRQLAKHPVHRSYAQSLTALFSCLCCWWDSCSSPRSCCVTSDEVEKQVELAALSIGRQYMNNNISPKLPLPRIQENNESFSERNRQSRMLGGGESSQMDVERRVNTKLLRHLLSSMLSSPIDKANTDGAGRRGLDGQLINEHLSSVALVSLCSRTYQSEVIDIVGSKIGKISQTTSSWNIRINEEVQSRKVKGLQLVAGSYAFVKCYGEPFLRCCLDNFKFGYAEGHELLAVDSEVFISGEIEVDEKGIVTRWLNKRGLCIPPRWILRQSGLPFELAWLHLSDYEVTFNIDSDSCVALKSAGALINLSDDNGIDNCVCDCTACNSHNVKKAAFGERGSANRIFNEPKGAACSRKNKRMARLNARNVDDRNEEEVEPSLQSFWILKVSADSDTNWHMPLSTSAYVGARETGGRTMRIVRNFFQRRETSSSIVLPGDIIMQGDGISSLTHESLPGDIENGNDSSSQEVPPPQISHHPIMLGTLRNRRDDHPLLLYDSDISSSGVSSPILSTLSPPHIGCPPVSVPNPHHPCASSCDDDTDEPKGAPPSIILSRRITHAQSLVSNTTTSDNRLDSELDSSRCSDNYTGGHHADDSATLTTMVLTNDDKRVSAPAISLRVEEVSAASGFTTSNAANQPLEQPRNKLWPPRQTQQSPTLIAPHVAHL